MLIEMATHPYLKGLTETRARADARFLQATRQLLAVTQELNVTVQKFDELCTSLEKKCSQLKNGVTAWTQQIQAAKNERDACDRLIRKFDQRIDPDKIRPINGWQGRYGRRGELNRLVQGIVEQAYPLEISTQSVAQILEDKLGLSFFTVADRAKWLQNSGRGRLKYLARTGAIERLHDPLVQTNQPGWWRACPAGKIASLEEHAAMAVQVPGVAVFSGDYLPAVAHEDDELPR